MKKYVLDANALIALFQKEDGADIVENILVTAMDSKCTVSIHRLNLLEVYYGYLRADGKTVADKYIAATEASCIQIDEIISKELMLKAGELKVKYSMSLADAMAVAHAITARAAIITSDHHELDAVDKNGDAEFFWFR
ncbi:MAG: PIN domain-containing protein [Defluviitaleaceae bacterium]|nr:PIN domain-containing protein [Defluviitaleaceae bacterium]